jgi:hypothetical protein
MVRQAVGATAQGLEACCVICAVRRPSAMCADRRPPNCSFASEQPESALKGCVMRGHQQTGVAGVKGRQVVDPPQGYVGFWSWIDSASLTK